MCFTGSYHRGGDGWESQVCIYLNGTQVLCIPAEDGVTEQEIVEASVAVWLSKINEYRKE